MPGLAARAAFCCPSWASIDGGGSAGGGELLLRGTQLRCAGVELCFGGVQAGLAGGELLLTVGDGLPGLVQLGLGGERISGGLDVRQALEFVRAAVTAACSRW